MQLFEESDNFLVTKKNLKTLSTNKRMIPFHELFTATATESNE